MRRGAPLIAALIALVVAGLAFFLLVWPKMGEVRDTQGELEQARSQQLVLETELARLRGLQMRAPELRARLAQLRREVPPVADLPGVINRLQRAANRAGVDFFSISPGTPTVSAEGSAAVIPAEVQVVGEFFSVDEFLFRLEDMNRAAKVTTIAVTTGAVADGDGGDADASATTGETVLTVALSVEFYTTDVTAGPGAPVEGVPEETPQPGASPSPSPSPSPTPSPTEGA